MNVRFYFACLVIFLSSTLYASSSSHHPSVADLIFPAMNFILLFGGIFLLTRKQLKKFFDNKSGQIAIDVERAELKSKEAKLRYEMFQRKMENSLQETKSIEDEAISESFNYEKERMVQMQKKVEKLREDAISRVALEKDSLFNEINRQLVESVVREAKSKVKKSADLKSKISAKILRDVGI